MINSKIIKWARERAGITLEEASKKISPKYLDWEEGNSKPTIKQLKNISKKFNVPFGVLFLPEPPEEKLPLTDFRTIKNKILSQPSINLLDTVNDAKRKQNWLREQKFFEREAKIFPEKNYSDIRIINEIKKLLDLENLRENNKNYEDFLIAIIEKLDKKGFIIIRNGIVGNNTHRPLNRDEFKGFALFDEFAPLIFINNKDYKSSQIFTIIHELVHLFLRESALDGGYNLNTEQRCNKLAAEILLPKNKIEADFQRQETVESISKKYRVSVFVVLIRAKQCNLITKQIFEEKWQEHEDNFLESQPKDKKNGGNFYNNIRFRAGGENYLTRIYHSIMAGETLYRDAYHLTGLNGKTFNSYFHNRDFVL